MRKLAFLWLLVACGGGSGGAFGTGPITDEQADDLCRADCQHDIDCGGQRELETCVTSCKVDIVGWARADAVETFFTCSAALPCDASEDACLDDVQPLAIHDQWETGCRSELATCLTLEQIESLCEVSPGGGDVGFVRVIAPAIVEEMIDCLAAPACETRLDCLQNVFQAHNIDF